MVRCRGLLNYAISSSLWKRELKVGQVVWWRLREPSLR